MTSFLRRSFRAAMLQPSVYEEVEADSAALPQALILVCLSSIATGAAYWNYLGVAGLLAGLIAGLIGWLLWTWLTYEVGSRWLSEETTKADWGQLLRTTGFATAPGMLRVVAIHSGVRDAVMMITAVWMLITFVLAVRQALDYRQTWRALLACMAGWVISTGILLMTSRAF